MDKKLLLENIASEAKRYKHKLICRVKFHEVDSFHVVHNIQYLYWLEWARLEYMKDIGIPYESKKILKDFPMMVVHTDIDYFNSAGFNDEYEILTRISFLKDSSIGFENIVRLCSGQVLIKCSAVLVHLNNQTLKPERIDDLIRDLIIKYEENQDLL